MKKYVSSDLMHRLYLFNMSSFLSEMYANLWKPEDVPLKVKMLIFSVDVLPPSSMSTIISTWNEYEFSLLEEHSSELFVSNS